MMTRQHCDICDVIVGAHHYGGRMIGTPNVTLTFCNGCIAKEPARVLSMLLELISERYEVPRP